MNPTERRRGRENTESHVDESELDRQLEADDSVLRDRLRQLFDADTDVGERTAEDVDRTLRARSTLGAALELLGVGWWTATALLSDDTPGADKEPEGI